MNLQTFRQALTDHPAHPLRFVLDNHSAIADHFHVTEVGRVEKRFVDCGGQPRLTVACVLQTLVAHDTQHRLSSDKLARIMQLADQLELPHDVPVLVEHQERSVSIDSLDSATTVDGVLCFHLAARHTACLAEDACGIGPAPSAGLNVIEPGCCHQDGPGCC